MLLGEYQPTTPGGLSPYFWNWSYVAHSRNTEYGLRGAFSAPVRGYLYFPFSGKTKSIKKAVLLFRGEQGEATLNLK